MTKRVNIGLSGGGRIIKRLTILFVVIAVVLSVIAPGFHAVPAGHQGVILQFGKPIGVADEGLYVWAPYWSQNVVDVTTQILKFESVLASTSNDQQDVKATIAVNYRLLPGAVLETYRTFTLDWEFRVIKPNLEEAVKSSMAEFPAQELITKRAVVRDRMSDIFTARLSPYQDKISIEAVSIVGIEFSPSYTAAIESKVVAEQEALREKNVLEKVRIQAQQREAEAKGIALADIAQAQGFANATVTKARAEAEALRLVREQLTPIIVQKIALDRWDGALPTVIAGEGLPFILGLEGLRLRQQSLPQPE